MDDMITRLRRLMALYEADGDLAYRDFLAELLQDALEDRDIRRLAAITDFDAWLATCLVRED